MATEYKTIGIVGAMSSEIDAVKAILTDPTTKTVSGIEFLCGDYCGKRIVAAKSGIGKVFAAICVQSMILTFAPDMILHIGVAGGLSSDLQIGDIAIGSSVVQHDMDTTAVGDPLGLISGINLVYLPCSDHVVKALEACADKLGFRRKTGVIASGDCFVNSTEKKNHIIKHFDAIACEMEGASTGHVCYVNNVDFCVLRGISDNGDENSGRDYMECMMLASDKVFRLVKEYLTEL